MSEKNVKFKNAVGGYNKNDVNAYLASVSAGIKSKEEAYEMQCARLRREIDEERLAKEEARARLDELACELFAAYTRETELKNAASGLAARVAELEAELEKRSAEIETTTAERDDTDENADMYFTDGDMSVAEKAALYDKLGDRIGEIMLNANSNAEQILKSASERAEEILERAKNDAGDIMDSAEKEAGVARERYKRAIGDYYDEVSEFVLEIREALENFVKDVGARSAALEGKFDCMNSSSLPTKDEITADCKEKETEPKEKKSFSAIDEKIEKFFKRTMAAINSFRAKR